MKFVDFVGCFFGPELYKRYVTADGASLVYKANFFETCGGNLIVGLRTCYHLCVYLSPIYLSSLIFRQGFESLIATSTFWAKVGACAAVVYTSAILIRGIGRAANRDYLTFMGILNESKTNPTFRRLMGGYDFEFHYWPVDYVWQNKVQGENVRKRTFLPDGYYQQTDGYLRQIARNVSCYVAAHAFGRRLMYPGSLWIMNALIWPALLDGRTKLIEEKQGRRFKLKASNNNSVDTLFVDRRNEPLNSNGSKLVIVCEGNAGYYEIGSCVTPIEAGYSVLGWNHPGFGGSTGVPWPEDDAVALDVVVQFAINKLGFPEEDISIFAWSIGGFAASWAGMNYRNLRSLILDATFDDVLPLAQKAMPDGMSSLVEQTVRTYTNLHVADQLKHYSGPALFYRRTKDEILSTDTSNADAYRRTNRANDLLKSFLSYRYPKIFNADTMDNINVWLEHAVEVRTQINQADEERCVEMLSRYFTRNPIQFPSDFGEDFDQDTKNKLALFLSIKHFIDVDSTHCTPLPNNVFKIPRHPWELLID